MKNILTILDIKQAIWDGKFRMLFPEYDKAIKDFLKDPGCTCNIGLVRDIMRHKDRLAQYFPDKKIIDDNKNDWGVINCNINQLEKKLQKLPKIKRVIAAARYQDEITIITNNKFINLDLEQDEKWKVINTTIDNLLNELKKIKTGQKMITLTRFQENITAIVSNIGI